MTPALPNFSFESRRDGHAVEHGVEPRRRQVALARARGCPIWHRLRAVSIHFIEALGGIRWCARRRVVRNVLVVDGLVMHVCPRRLLHGLPMPNAFSRQSSKNCGSCFFLDMAATTPSSSPGGRLSDSISVMKPCRYFCARRASTSWVLVDTGISSCHYASVKLKWGSLCRYSAEAGREFPDARSATRRKLRPAPANWRKVTSSSARRMAAFTRCHAAPTRHWPLDAALARRAAAFGDCDRPSNTSRIALR